MYLTIEQQTKVYQTEIEKYLSEKCFSDQSVPQKTLFDAARYSLLAGGKRLRPILVLDFARMCGLNWQSAMPFAAAVEMIHTYSLIHDDLPCMDDDDLRRGKPTNHKVYGEAIAVLAGDALLTSAFSQITDADLDTHLRLDAVRILALCAGEFGMVGGQVLDIQSEERQCTKQEVIDIQSRKTGALIKAACVLGVVAAGGNASFVKAAEGFAENMGIAFQIRDDILDVIGSADTLGKAVGTDETKNTFVHLYGLEKCKELVNSYTNQALEYLSVFPDCAYMKELTLQLVGRTN